MNKKIKLLKDSMNKWNDGLDADNVRYQIILKVFLPCMGYDTDDCKLGDKIAENIYSVYVPTTSANRLLIGVKSSNDILTDDDIRLAKRFAADKELEYVILTNGKEYILLNFKLEIGLKRNADSWNPNVVFWFDIFTGKSKSRTDLRYFDYLTCEKLFDKGVTSFFKDIKQYKIWKMQEGLSELSWLSYQSTLYNYYDFVAQKYQNYEGTYEKMSEDDFEEFITTRKRKGGSLSIKTVANNHTHVYDMLLQMRNHKKILHFNFEENRNKSLKNFLQTDDKKKAVRLQRTDIAKALQLYSGKRNATRDIIVYLMCSTLGMERSEVLNVKWENFDKGFSCLRLHNRTIELHDMIKKYLRLFQQEQGRKTGYLFVTLYNGEYKQVNESTINEIFNELKGIDSIGEAYSPKYLKNCLIMSMFYDGYFLEDIIYVTGLDMKNLSKHITREMIIDRKTKHFDWGKLYDGILCE